MKLLVGRLILGCFLAVLVLADDPVVEVTEKVESTSEIAIAVPDTPEPVDPEPAGRIFAKPDETIIIPDEGRNPQHGDDNHHHHHTSPPRPPQPRPPPHHNHQQPPRPVRPHDNDHDHHHHHHTSPPRPPSHHHHHPPSPPHYHPSYSPYYPPYYPPPPPPYHYGPPIYAPVPQPYPYYHQHGYFPQQMKPVTTVIHTIDGNSGSSGHGSGSHGSGSHGSGSHGSGSHGSGSHGSGSNVDNEKPHTGFLWNLIDHKNSELWNLFGNKLGSGDEDDDIKGDRIHEIVVINAKPGATMTQGKNLGGATDCNVRNEGEI